MSRRSGRRTLIGERGGLRRGFEQMPVDGEAVVRVVLRPAAHRLPLRQQAHDEAVLVERPRRPGWRRGRCASSATSASRVSGGQGAAGGAASSRSRSRVAREIGAPVAAGGGRDAHRQRRIVQGASAVTHDLVVAEHDAGAHDAILPRDSGRSGPSGSSRSDATGRRSSSRSCAPRSTSVHQGVGVAGHPAPRRRHRAAGARAGRSPSRWCGEVRRARRAASRPRRRTRARTGATSGSRASVARSAFTSRSPPRPSFRSGSRRNATSPKRWWRSAVASASARSHFLCLRCQPSSARRARSSPSFVSPAIVRASSRPSAALRSRSATSTPRRGS